MSDGVREMREKAEAAIESFEEFQARIRAKAIEARGDCLDALHMKLIVEGATYGYQECKKSDPDVRALRDALERIVRKVPEKVSREEAADMACEFKILAKEALAKFEEGK